jgi:hypothetical protein
VGTESSSSAIPQLTPLKPKRKRRVVVHKKTIVQQAPFSPRIDEGDEKNHNDDGNSDENGHLEASEKRQQTPTFSTSMNFANFAHSADDFSEEVRESSTIKPSF